MNFFFSNRQLFLLFDFDAPEQLIKPNSPLPYMAVREVRNGDVDFGILGGGVMNRPLLPDAAFILTSESVLAGTFEFHLSLPYSYYSCLI